jgi:diguanylate cyclase (GGDEF)-like protein/PAS domain S-box-containing protein
VENLLRVLIVEDRPKEALQVVEELERGGYDVRFRRADRQETLLEALESSQWDAVICSYAMARFSGMEALRLVRERGIDKPFIMIAGRIGAEAAARAIRAGADDLLLKKNLPRLSCVVTRELAEAARRQEQRRSEQELREKLDFIQVLIDTLPTPIFYNDANGLYLGCNKAFEEQIGLKRDEIVNKSAYDVLPPDLAELYTRGEEALELGRGPRTFEGTISCADGEDRDVIFYSAVFNRADSSAGGVVGALLDISERKRSEMKLRYLSSHDILTGIYNRAYFDEELERLKKGRKFPVSIVMADVDRLKETNDQCGHAAGDELLRHTAEVFKGAFRREDVAARIGGDEFAALLPNTDEAALAEAMDRLQQHLDQENARSSGKPLSLSIGAATAHNGEELLAAWRMADQHMYLQKKGRSACNRTPAPLPQSLWQNDECTAPVT